MPEKAEMTAALSALGAPLQVTLLDRQLRGLSGPKVPRLLRVGLAAAGIAAAASLVLNTYLGGWLQ